MRPGLQQGCLPSQSEALLTLVTEDAGKCAAGGVGQYLSVFCWELPPDHMASRIPGCLATGLFVLRAGMDSVQGDGKRLTTR